MVMKQALRLRPFLTGGCARVAVASQRFAGTITGKHKHLPLTKVVATIGPASEQLPVLPEVVVAGMRIMRLNFSHATYDEVG